MSESDTDKAITRNFLKLYGDKLIDQGYTVVPIQQGKKAPGFDGWQKSKPSKATVAEWLKSGFKNAGVGILTKFTCAIDIDCLDEDAAQHFETRALELLGTAPIRFGMAPKRLLLYRTVEPFRKLLSGVYEDEWSQRQQIEVLADGQQFVAFHIHPVTGKPYYWADDRSPLTVRATDLTEITQAQIETLLEEFEAYAKEQKWTAKRAADSANGRNGKIDKNNPWIEDSHPIDISTDELRTRLLLIDVDGPGYHQWLRVGMALYHQFNGDQDGFDLWNEWSETSAQYDLDELERKWDGFAIEGKQRAPLTARYIIRLAKEAISRTAIELSITLRDAFINAKDLTEWERARELAQKAEIDGLARSALAVVAKDRRDGITGTRTSLSEIKRAIAYTGSKNDKMPKWCEAWVYDISEDKFYHTERKIAASKQGFDAMYDRYSLTRKDILDGKTNPTQSASDLALVLHRIPTVDGQRYMPGRDAIFHEPNGKFVNTYPEHEIPEKPDRLTPRDKKNVERVQKHIAHLLASEEEQRMLLDWLAWVVQNPGRHVNYAVLLQGVEGDGKTFFAEMLRVVMGISNVTMANANTVIKSDFSDWAYGQCVCCVEEVRLANSRGIDKWEAINKIKPFIANAVVEIHPKGKKSFNVVNTTSYFMTSNFRDALPLDDNSRRYLILFSQWQHREDIRRFKVENPSYYVRLYATLTESPGALRQWLLDHEPAEGFDPMGDAPETRARKVMIRKSKPELIQILDDLIEEDSWQGICRDFVDASELHEAAVAMGVEWPGPKTLTAIMERDGYESLGKIKIDGSIRTFYSKIQTDYLIYGKEVDVTKIRAALKARASKSSIWDDPDEI